jgi:hypothetical protein
MNVPRLHFPSARLLARKERTGTLAPDRPWQRLRDEMEALLNELRTDRKAAKGAAEPMVRKNRYDD